MDHHLPIILLVDDQPDNLVRLSECLDQGYTTLEAQDTETSVKRARKNGADLVLINADMDNGHGVETCRQLKKNEKTRHIPVLFLSSKPDPELEQTGFRAGAADFIRAPFSPPIVNTRIKTQLELKRKTDILHRLASVDDLTGVPNWRRFEFFLKKEWKRALRAQKPLSILLMNIDHFKLYKEHYGEEAGDACLKKMARRLKTTVRRPADLFARYVDEEFAAVLPDTDIKGAQLVANNMVRDVEALKIPHEHSKTSEWITVSVGVASTVPTRSSRSPHVLVRAAENMVVQAKEKGRNQVKGMVFSPHFSS